MSQIESLSQIEEKLNNLSLTAKNNIDNSNTHEELGSIESFLARKKVICQLFENNGSIICY